MQTNVMASFDNWIGGRNVQSLSTNAGTNAIPFQSWRHFKEAFAPELVRRAIAESPIPITTCLDPFGGSGTTALSCQFLGVRPIIIEVNPFLADLIEAKLAHYDPESIARDFGRLVRKANALDLDPIDFYSTAPLSFVEPGLKNRWIFDVPVAARLAAYVAALTLIENETNRRLFRILLGGTLIELSNVIISGKGRRYRGAWQKRQRSAEDVDDLFCRAVEIAIIDIMRYADRAYRGYCILRGDARRLASKTESPDISIFSPPYPNSFDYTDVYNVELWALRYFKGPLDNTNLRLNTISSHVQIQRDFPHRPAGSPQLEETLSHLTDKRHLLWDRRIPEMVAGYFADIKEVIVKIIGRLAPGGQIWAVVGDSGYAGVRIPVADIITQLCPSMGCSVVTYEPFRSMRTSVQQGRNENLNETLLVLRS